jgi:hypothetical protein
MIHGTVGAYGHAMAAIKAEFTAAIDKAGKSTFGFEFDYLCRTFGDADTILLAFFMIHSYQAHYFPPIEYIAIDIGCCNFLICFLPFRLMAQKASRLRGERPLTFAGIITHRLSLYQLRKLNLRVKPYK